jgi:membrane-bound metal-dependent hydrolase YbcI (DUF457 family)
MASYRGHLTFSTALGAAYGGLAWWKLGVPLPLAAVAGGLTALGGLLPDLDSDSGVPVRELFGLAGAVVPLLLLRRLARFGLSAEETLLAVAGLYAGIRYGLANVFKHLTVHRGMFHSLPAMLIAGLLVYLGYKHPSEEVRGFLAVGVMLGFLSHLVLDELCAVDFRGLTPRLNQFAGSAVKLTSKSLPATVFTYAILASLAYVAFMDHAPDTGAAAAQDRQPLHFEDRPPEHPPLRWQPASPARPSPAIAIPPRN